MAKSLSSGKMFEKMFGHIYSFCDSGTNGLLKRYFFCKSGPRDHGTKFLLFGLGPSLVVSNYILMDSLMNSMDSMESIIWIPLYGIHELLLTLNFNQ